MDVCEFFGCKMFVVKVFDGRFEEVERCWRWWRLFEEDRFIEEVVLF